MDITFMLDTIKEKCILYGEMPVKEFLDYLHKDAASYMQSISNAGGLKAVLGATKCFELADNHIKCISFEPYAMTILAGESLSGAKTSGAAPARVSGSVTIPSTAAAGANGQLVEANAAVGRPVAAPLPSSSSILSTTASLDLVSQAPPPLFHTNATSVYATPFSSSLNSSDSLFSNIFNHSSSSIRNWPVDGLSLKNLPPTTNISNYAVDLSMAQSSSSHMDRTPGQNNVNDNSNDQLEFSEPEDIKNAETFGLHSSFEFGNGLGLGNLLPVDIYSENGADSVKNYSNILLSNPSSKASTGPADSPNGTVSKKKKKKSKCSDQLKTPPRLLLTEPNRVRCPPNAATAVDNSSDCISSANQSANSTNVAFFDSLQQIYAYFRNFVCSSLKSPNEFHALLFDYCFNINGFLTSTISSLLDGLNQPKPTELVEFAQSELAKFLDSNWSFEMIDLTKAHGHQSNWKETTAKTRAGAGGGVGIGDGAAKSTIQGVFKIPTVPPAAGSRPLSGLLADASPARADPPRAAAALVADQMSTPAPAPTCLKDPSVAACAASQKLADSLAAQPKGRMVDAADADSESDCGSVADSGGFQPGSTERSRTSSFGSKSLSDYSGPAAFPLASTVTSYAKVLSDLTDDAFHEVVWNGFDPHFNVPQVTIADLPDRRTEKYQLLLDYLFETLYFDRRVILRAFQYVYSRTSKLHQEKSTKICEDIFQTCRSFLKNSLMLPALKTSQNISVEPFSHQLKFCMYFDRDKGTCFCPKRATAKCTFAHSLNELRPFPRFIPCMYFLDAHCKQSMCYFGHYALP